MLRLAFDFIITWRETRTRPNAYLSQVIPSMTESDLQVCCLIKLRFSNLDIADILNISPTSVSKRKFRLKERIIQKLGSLGESHTLDLWLLEF